MKKIIELKDFYRREVVEMFSTFNNPNLTVTSEVECTGARERAKEQGITFSLLYTHALLKAANEIVEFKYRINMTGEIVLYDELDTMILVSNGDNGEYLTLPLSYIADKKEFCEVAMRKIELIRADVNSFKDEKEAMKRELNHFIISSAPFLSFTSNSLVERSSWKCFFPVSSVGKLVIREGKEYIPIAVSVCHAFVDGFHLGKLFERVKELMEE